jgi:Undecaprenyl-phosphate galactose phosphotransferase WbaP
MDMHSFTKKASARFSSYTITLIFLIADLLAIVIAFLCSFLIRQSLGHTLELLTPLRGNLVFYFSFWPILFIWPIIFWLEKLYPGLWLTESEVVKRVMRGTTLASLIVITTTFLTKTGGEFSRPIRAGWWFISLVLLPLGRVLAGFLIGGLGFHGSIAVMLGAGRTAEVVLEGLGGQRVQAIRPVALFDDDERKHGREIYGVKVVGPIQLAPAWASKRKIRAVIIAMPGVPRDILVPIIDRIGIGFRRVIVIPDLFGLSTTDTDIHEIEGVQVLELHRNLFLRRNRFIKRATDFGIAIVGGVLSLPFLALISLAIVIESGRPIFYKHKRIGLHGEEFSAWKFRTMVKNAHEVLDQFLTSDDDLLREWESTQKLKFDPRLTKVGKLLRRFSLDEVPQIINVLRGEMSLIGPRPIIEDEVSKYGYAIELYKQVRPGLTGLWQVRGRSDVDYNERVRLDTYYVRNWSIWLDIVILVRTVWVVTAGVGAY